jgi:sugar phosphate permease
LSFSQSEASAVWACFAVEFCQSVQWPCIIVILAAHYNNQGRGMYEGGIYVTSLASRFGSLLAIPLSSLLLRMTTWRVVAQCGALVSLTGSIVMFFFVSDSPLRRNDPQNPISEKAIQEFKAKCQTAPSGLRIAKSLVNLIRSVFVTNLVPSLRAVLKSGTFWIVAIAHTGSSMVRSSERILGIYFRDTSFDTLTENRAGGLVVFLSLGTILGLAIGGSIFSRRNAKERKRMVSKLYLMSIGACYVLALLAVPRLRLLLGASGMVLVFQIMATFVMGFGVAVQCYQIPGIVGATFGHNKGLYAAYTDGVAYGLSSGVWRIVGDAVQEGNPQGGGWAYGWAGVALMVVVGAVLMVEFMEHYFVRTCQSSAKQGGGYETIIFV